MAGQPTKYKSEYCEEIIEFFSLDPWEQKIVESISKQGEKVSIVTNVPCQLPTMAKFAVDRDVCRETVCEWQRVHPEFSDAVKKAKALQENILIQNGLFANYDKTMSIFCLKNLAHWKDKQEVEHSGKSEIKLVYNLED